MLLRLFVGVIIFFLLRWLFFKLYDQSEKYRARKKERANQEPLFSLDELEKKAESNLKEREEIRDVTDQTQEQLKSISKKIK